MNLKDYFSENLSQFTMDQEAEKEVRRQKFWAVHLMFLKILHFAWIHTLTTPQESDDTEDYSKKIRHYIGLKKKLSFERGKSVKVILVPISILIGISRVLII